VWTAAATSGRGGGRNAGALPLRYSNADVRVEGWLVKRGKRLGSRVERYLRLDGSTLTNSRGPAARVTWSVNVRGCKVLSGPGREIVFKVGKSFSSFFAPNDAQHLMWVEALQAVSATVTEFYDFGKLIGRGAYSEVFLARDQLRNELCAIKVLERVDREHGKLIDRELRVLRMLQSPHLVRTCDIFDTPTQTYVVMEYLAGGELLDLITDNDHLSERTARHVLRQVLRAVLYLHEQGIAHRDVKPENILLASNQSELPRIKLTDFGLSRVVGGGVGGGELEQLMHSQCGTAYYLAPEIANNLDYGKAVDLWACGVVAFVMLAGKFPFYGDSDDRFMRRLRAGVQFPQKEWAHISPAAMHLIRGLLDPNPETRLTAQQALDHRWLAEDAGEPGASTSHMALGDARNLKELQLAAKNESLSLQLLPYAPTRARRRDLLAGGRGADGVGEEDVVLRTEELAIAPGDDEFATQTHAYEMHDSDDESRRAMPAFAALSSNNPPVVRRPVRAAEV
jgi:serine/threonine protein kinase